MPRKKKSKYEEITESIMTLEKENGELREMTRKVGLDNVLVTHEGHTMTFRERKEEDKRKVRGVFRSLKPPGGNVTFPFKKYKEDTIEFFSFEDGKEYEIPKMVADHLNYNCYEEEKSYCVDINGNPIPGKKEHRFVFNILK